jgi:hypothetical protein
MPAISKSICSRAKNLTAHSCQLLPPTIKEQDKKDTMMTSPPPVIDSWQCHLLIAEEEAMMINIREGQKVMI